MTQKTLAMHQLERAGIPFELRFQAVNKEV